MCLSPVQPIYEALVAGLARFWQPCWSKERGMTRVFLILCLLSGCGGLAWNTTVADEPVVRRAMIDSISPGVTTESQFITRWGRPTQIVREGGEKRLIYRNMSNPVGYAFPQFGTSASYVVVVFQYGRAISAYSNDTEGCRGAFAPRPPGQAFDNPTTVHAVNCGVGRNGIGGPFDGIGTSIQSDDYSAQAAGHSSGKL